MTNRHTVLSRFSQQSGVIAGWLLGVGLSAMALSVHAQQLDMDYLPKAAPKKASPTTSSPSSVVIPESVRKMKPLTATVSKTLYLPPAMYGQWNVTGVVIETNVSNTIPVANDLWVLARDGDLVTVTNPTNGATAAVNVEAVEGNTATFRKSNRLGNIVKSETVTITVNGDHFSGRNLIREERLRDEKVVKSHYALFDLQGTRISGARTRFRPDSMAEGPDLEIAPVQRQ